MKENFSKRVQAVMKYAKEEAIRLGHSYVGSEHLLLGILRGEKCLSMKILDIFDCDVDGICAMVEDMIKASGGTMTLGHLPLTRRAERILRNAYNEAIALGIAVADDEHLLLAILRESEGIAFEVMNAYNLDYESVKEFLQKQTTEEESVEHSVLSKSSKTKTPALDHFSRDLTRLAQKGKLDPVIGRVNEIERVAQILTRRKKNNPVLIGEPGVGKTAIVEGLAHRITEKSVPGLLHNKRVLSLDLAAIVAGTKYRGQFEERMKTIMVEMENSDNLILFIDELHTIVGAGGATGSLDASNIFKPALARGDIRCIGATTMDEYRKHIEKDGALERRFQKILINPPTTEESVQILNGLKSNYENHHNVIYHEKAIEACVGLSHRYISDRFLPDKAIDAMDEAGSRAHMLNMKVPQAILDIEVKIDKIREEKEQVVTEQKFEKAASLRDKEQKLMIKLAEVQKKWNKEEGKNPVLITEDHIADVVSLMTGIPMAKVAQSETQKLLNIEKEIHKYIVGQNEAIKCLSGSIQRARAGLKSPHRPIGVFLFLGPTGVGKTELAKVIANYLFSYPDALIKIDMTEYGERFSVSRMIGAPPGYVGYEEGGALTEKVRRNPYSVVLFDEIEKAHPDVFNVLLQLFDEGVLTDGLGRKVDFKNTIIIMTSNVGTREIQDHTSFGFTDTETDFDYSSMKDQILDQVKLIFNPEFLNRIDDTIVFHPLSRQDALEIVDLLLVDLRMNLFTLNIELFLTKRAKMLLLGRGFSSKYGARNLRREIQSSLEKSISELLLENVFVSGNKIKVDTSDGQFTFNSVRKKRMSSKS